MAALPLLFVFSSCKKTIPPAPAEKDPVLTCKTEGDISASHEGGNYSIAYSLENPAKDGKLTASADKTEWILNLDYNVAGIVKFEVAANPDQTAREGNVTVKYEYPDGKPQSFSVKVVQEAAPVPPPAPYDVELLDAKILTGIYYAGNITEDGNMYYFIHITDVGFDDDGYALPNGKFFRIGLISKEAPEDMNHIGLPVGTFRLGSGDGGIDTEEGYYFETDADSHASDTGYYKEAECTISRDGSVYSVEFIATFSDGRRGHATYKGDVSLEDYSDPHGEGAMTTLTGDYVADLSGTDTVEAIYWGDYFKNGAGNWVLKAASDNKDGFSFEIFCKELDPTAPEPGTYTVTTDYEVGTCIQGTLFFGYMLGSWLYLYKDSEIHGGAPAIEGSMTLAKNDDGTYAISFDCIDDLKYNFKGSWTGRINVTDASSTDSEAMKSSRLYGGTGYLHGQAGRLQGGLMCKK